MQALVLSLVVGMLICIASASVEYDCGDSKRGGTILFSKDQGVRKEEAPGIVLFQCGNKAPNFNYSVADLRKANNNTAVPIADLSAMINAAYAARHGYRYEFHLFPSKDHVAPSWCRLFSMERILSSVPTAVVYMDQDVFIKTDLPLSLKHMRDHNKTRTLNLNEWHPAPYEDWTTGGYTVYDHLEGVPDRKLGMPMPVLQNAFETLPYFARRMWEQDLINPAGWVELGHPKGSHGAHRSESFIHHWWAQAKSHQGGRFLTEFPWDQRVVNMVLSKRNDARKQTALMEDVLFHSPTSECMPHMYGEYKKIPKYLGGAYRHFMEKSAQYMDRLPVKLEQHEEYEMAHNIQHD